MIAPPIFQLSIMPSIKIAAENIHCALGSPLAIEKRRNLVVFLTPLRTLQTRAAFIAPLLSLDGGRADFSKKPPRRFLL
jgi:hypothetical protein